MGKEIRANYDQHYLMPPSLEEWVGVDHPARFIRDFVDVLDLEGLGFRIPEALDGRPPYASDLLLKVWLYGYMNRIRSSRKLEMACREHLSCIWLTGAHYPDHNTLWRFWAGNRRALREVFRQAVFVAVKADLVGLVLHAVDGTKIAANVSQGNLWRKPGLIRLLAELDSSIDEVMKQVDQAESTELGDYRLPDGIQDIRRRRDKIRESLAELEKAGCDYLHPHDLDARLMKQGDQKSGIAFNAQVMVDQKSGLVVAQEVINKGNDNAMLVSMAEATRSNLGTAAEETVADAGYYAPGQLAEAEQKGLHIMVSMFEDKDKRWGKGEFQKSNFTYDEKADIYICPLGRKLRYEGTRRDRYHRFCLRVYRCAGGVDCPCRSECSRVKQGRIIERGEHEWAVERQRAKQKDPAKRKLLRKRKAIVEHVFGQIKEHQAFRRFSVRGLENVRTQWALVCTAFNLNKLYRQWLAGTLILT